MGFQFDSLWWVHPGQQPSTHTAPNSLAAAALHSEMEEKIGRTKSTQSWVKIINNLISEEEKVDSGGAPGHGRLMPSQSPNNSQKTCLKTKKILFFLYPSFYFCTWEHITWNIPLVTLSQLSQLCPVPASYPPSAWLWGCSGKQRWPWHCASTAQQ